MQRYELNKKFHASIRYKKNILYEFYTNDVFSGMVKIASLLEKDFSYAVGEIKDLVTHSIVYQSRKSSIC